MNDLWDRIDYKVSDAGCWDVTSHKPNTWGYPAIEKTVDKKRIRTTTNRVSYFHHNGPFDESLCVCHTCDNPRCVNPDHLWLGTNADNSRDMARKGRSHKPVGVLNGCSKLTDEIVVGVLRRIEGGESHSSIARGCDVARSCISKISRGESWKHVERMAV